MRLVVEPLAKHHDRSRFACGEAALDDWFRHRASQDERRNVARVFVAMDSEEGLVGYYSLNAFTLAVSDIPPDLAHKRPRYDSIPAALIGRLARDDRVRGRGVGELLLADAIRRIIGASDTLAIYAVVVDAKNEGASRFYEEYGFRAFTLRPNRLFLPLATARASMR